jgi:hypothetical protein
MDNINCVDEMLFAFIRQMVAVSYFCVILQFKNSLSLFCSDTQTMKMILPNLLLVLNVLCTHVNDLYLTSHLCDICSNIVTTLISFMQRHHSSVEVFDGTFRVCVVVIVTVCFSSYTTSNIIIKRVYGVYKDDNTRATIWS